MGITMILSLLSGVALFLYGMALMGDSLKKVAGNKLELLLPSGMIYNMHGIFSRVKPFGFFSLKSIPPPIGIIFS